MLLEINPENPEPRKIRRAVDALRAGEVIAYPTDTVYGIGCDLFEKKAVDRLYQIKNMPKSHQLSFVCRDFAEITNYAVVYDREFRILKKFLPGPYCFILNATRTVPKIVQTSRKQVGIRIPAHAVAHALVAELGHPIISSTAARTGEAPHVDPNEIDDDFQGLAMVLDGGPGGLQPTTVIDLTTDEPVIVREGAGDTSFFK
ncbi:MAG TPA: L-threonylcarbamoyladenylate synthase [Polyangiaceae bacterium]|jgi:tRNA threonylcarbamoyl adenosine modification protein (Sua5/YciO/YrdC/YwlC family)|nr:L-threonylcarbamoyladenylate synthase [Polyangiaceae bacterium]